MRKPRGKSLLKIACMHFAIFQSHDFYLIFCDFLINLCDFSVSFESFFYFCDSRIQGVSKKLFDV